MEKSFIPNRLELPELKVLEALLYLGPDTRYL